MLRVLLYVTLLGALFVGAVLWTGNAIGAWEPSNLPLHAPDGSTPDSSTPDTKKGKKHGKHEQPAKRDKKR